MRTTLLLLFLTGVLQAQRGPIGGPTPGYVFDKAAKTLRPIRGVVGAAHLGTAVLRDSDEATPSPDGSLAVVSRFGAAEVVRGFDSAEPATLELTREPGAVLFAWSGHDLAAVFTETKRALIWRSGPAAAEKPELFDLPDVDGAINALVFDGERLLISAKGGLFTTTREGTKRILSLDDPVGLAVAGGDVYAADRVTGQILVIRDYAGKSIVEPFASAEAPVGLQVVSGKLLVANAGSRSVESYDLLSKERTGRLELDFVPTRMAAVGSQPLALLNQGSPDEPLFALDAKDALHVYFVPAGREQ